MPSGILAAGSSAERYPRGCQAQVPGVEVLGLQPMLHRLIHPVNPGQVLQRRKEGRILDIKLPFDLNNLCRGHSQFYVPGRRAGQQKTAAAGLGPGFTAEDRTTLRAWMEST